MPAIMPRRRAVSNGGGRLRDRIDDALQFALAQNALDAFTIGAESPQELQDLLQRIPAASVRG